MHKTALNFLCIVLITSFSLKADISDYIYPVYGESINLFGSHGLIQTPSARFSDDGTARFTFSDSGPFKRGVITAYPFSWMEASYRYVDIAHTLYSQSFEFSGDQTLKDKGFNLKLRLFKETRYLPDLAIGFRDLAGTGRFSSEYIVASKRSNNFNINLGLATGFLGSENNIKNPFRYISESFSQRTRKGSRSSSGGELAYETWFSGPSSLFFGFDYVLPYARGTVFKLEYDSNNYLEEGGKPLPKDSNYNFGFDFPIIKDNLRLSLNYERGNTFSLAWNISFNLSQNIVPHSKQEVKIEERFNYSKNRNVRSEAIYTNTLKHLKDNGIYLQSQTVDKKNKTSKILVSQGRYLSKPQLISQTFKVMNKTHPKIIENFHIEETTAGHSNYAAIISRDAFKEALDTYDTVLAKESIYIKEGTVKPFENINEFVPKVKYPIFHYNISPALRNHIGGPDAFYFGQAWIRIDAETAFSRKLFWKNIVGISLADNFGNLKLASDSVLPHVRTDIVKYLKQGKNNILRSQLNYVEKLNSSIFYKFSGGIFEEMFGGIGGEVMYRPFDKNFAVGADAYFVRQRNYEQDFGFQDYETFTGHLTFYYQEPKSRILFKLSGGKYLAKDSGVTFEAARYFRNGLEIGAFASQTDISKEEFGEGSFDKGFYFNVPIEIFLNIPAKHKTYFGLRPLTRDGAAKLIVGSNLWDLTTSHNYLNFMDKNDQFFR